MPKATQPIRRGTHFWYFNGDSDRLMKVTRSRGPGLWEAVFVNVESGKVRAKPVFRSAEISASLQNTRSPATIAERHDAYYASRRGRRVKAMPQAAQPIRRGTRFRYAYADGNPLWEVTRVQGSRVWEAVVVNEPIKIEGRLIPSDWAGIRKVFTADEISSALRMAEAHRSLMDEHEAFYGRLKPGAIVHYVESHNRFVRCRVVVEKGEKKLLPIALVGGWKQGDGELPRRLQNGKVAEGYYPTKIREKETFAPNFTNLVESPDCRPSFTLDPTTLDPIDLTVPPLNKEAKAQAVLWQAVEAAGKVLADDKTTDPALRLRLASRIIAQALNDR